MRLNKICGLEDFADPELAATIREVSAYKLACLPDLPRSAEHRKDWEVAMAVLALRRHGALRRDATILGVAAGTEDTLFYLTNHVRQVFATDRYVGPGAWGPVAPASMIVEPTAAAPCDFDLNRLVVQHMDARALRYPDDTFDGVFSSGSIEHVGELLDVANAAYEMGRVLKPGGILTLSTELQITGPPGGIGWPFATLIFSPADLLHYIVDATGLEPVDDFSTEISAATLATKQSLSGAIDDHRSRVARLGRPGEVDYTCWRFPHVVLEHEGYVFASVHLALRKTDAYPVVANEWARPPAATLESIRRYNLSLVNPPAADAGATAAAAGPAASHLDPGVAELVGDADVRRRLAVVDEHRVAVAAQLDAVAAQRQRIRPVTSAEHIGALAAPGADPASPNGAPGRARWQAARVTVPGSRPVTFTALVDPGAADPVSTALAGGHVLDETLVALMLQLVKPGDLVLDLGAHVGSFSLAAAAAGCRVVAVEASPANVALLRASAAANGFADLHVVHAAASDAPGTIEFCVRGPWGHVATEAVDLPTISVLAVTVDDLLGELGMGSPAFVKIDIEGSEIPAIRGMAGTLGGPAGPAVLYESNGHTLGLFGVRPPELVAELHGLGYTSLAVEPGRLVHVVPGRMQPQTIVDCLAVKGAVDLAGWAVEGALAFDERVGRTVSDGRHPNPDHRAYVAGALAGADAEVLSHPAVIETLELLVVDPVPAVRDAASWWSSPRLMTETA